MTWWIALSFVLRNPQAKRSSCRHLVLSDCYLSVSEFWFWFRNYWKVVSFLQRIIKSLDIEDSSWLQVQDKEIYSKRGLKHRATKERGFQEHARKSFPDFREADMTNPLTFFVEVDLLKKKIFDITTDVQIVFFFANNNVFLSCISVGRKITYNLALSFHVQYLRCRYLCISAECKIQMFLYCSFYV